MREEKRRWDRVEWKWSGIGKEGGEGKGRKATMGGRLWSGLVWFGSVGRSRFGRMVGVRLQYHTCHAHTMHRQLAS